MVGFYGELLPMTGPVLADPELIAWLRDDGPAKAQKEAAAKARGRAGGGQDDAAAPPGGPPAGHPGGAAAGPVMGHTALIGYLDAERRAAGWRPAHPCRTSRRPCSEGASSTPS